MVVFDWFRNSATFVIVQFGDRQVAFNVALAVLVLAVVVVAITAVLHHQFRQPIVHASVRLTRHGFGQIDHADDVFRNSPLQALWAPYRAAIHQSDGRTLNLASPYAWFGVESLPRRGYEKWTSTLAGVFLTVGLLFTFLGLSAALLHAGEAAEHATTDQAELSKAINGVLSASSAKFITSIAGIVAYIVLTIAARAYASGQSKMASRLAGAVQRLSSYTAPETFLVQISDEAREQSSRWRTLADDIAVSLERKLAPNLEALPSALGEALARSMGVALRTESESTHADLSAAAETMGRAAALLESAGQAIGQSSAAVLKNTEQAAQGMSDVIYALTQRLTQTERGLGNISESLRQHVADMTTAGVAINGAANAVQAAAEPLAPALRSLEASSEATRSAAERLQEAGTRAQETTSTAGAAAARAAEAITLHVERFTAVDHELARVVADMREGVASLADQLTGLLNQTERHLAGAVGSLQSGIEQLNESVEALNENSERETRPKLRVG